MGENKFERERETIIFSIQQYRLNSVIIFWKRHNILERCFFERESTSKSDLIFLLQRDQKGNVYVFMFYLEEPLSSGYPAHIGLICFSVCHSVHEGQESRVKECKPYLISFSATTKESRVKECYGETGKPCPKY